MRVLVDVTRDFVSQSESLPRIHAAVLTHGHADASGGIRALDRWLDRAGASLPVYTTAATLEVIARRWRRLESVELKEFAPGHWARIGDWTLSCLEVPHARDNERYPTVAWRLTTGGTNVVYASDVARPTSELRRFATNADVLVIDGATYKRPIFTHLRIDEDLRQVCGWRVERIYLTQIGKSVPPHEDLVRLVSQICPRATPAHDGLEVEI